MVKRSWDYGERLMGLWWQSLIDLEPMIIRAWLNQKI